jgi:hypothetical protein
MIRAILDGRKTQTRRPIVPQPEFPETLGELPCRFGAAGDLLWVRERWGYQRQFGNPRADVGGPIIYAADPTSLQFRGRAWRQSHFMPRAASRILLRINQIRTERLHQVTRADALAEGFDSGAEIADPIQWFHELWDRLSGDSDHCWKQNPWVWVVEFEIANQRHKGTKARRHEGSSQPPAT